MGALPRPDLEPGPHRVLVDALHLLHHRAGWPSLRTLAGEAGCSHTTVSKTFSTPTIPTWGVLELLVEAMDGDVHAFRDLWLAASTPSTDGTGPAPRIAGRRTELGVVRRHLEVGAGLLLVTGEAGIGKSAVVRAASEAAAVTVVTGHSLPLSSQVPFGPISGLLQELWSIDDGERIRAAIADCPDFVPTALGVLLPQLGQDEAPGVADDWVRQRLIVALRSVLRALAPIALVIEDLHWADGATLGCLEQLVAGRWEAPFVGTWRLHDDTPAPSLDWFDRVRRGANVVTLGPLSRVETGEQLAMLLGAEEASRRLDTIHARSHGQPLFTEQLSTHPDDGADLPPLLADLLDARVSGLSGVAWDVACSLGIADRPLPLDVISEVTGSGPDDIIGAMRALAHTRLLAEHSVNTIALRHPLLAEGVRRRVVPGEREAWHRRLAVVLGGRRDAAPAEVAEHWRQAGDEAAELGWRVHAADNATARSAAGEAASHWLRVLDLQPTDGDEDDTNARLDMWVLALDALDLAGREDEAFQLVLGLLEGEMSARHRLELNRRAAGFAWGQVGPERALELLDACGDGYDGPPPDALMVRTAPLRANLLAANGRQGESLSVLSAARELARSIGDCVTEAVILTCSIWHLSTAGDLDAALASAREVSTLDLDWSLNREVSVGMMVTDALLTHARPHAEVEAAGRAALAIVDEYDLHHTRGNMVRSNVCEALIRGGEVERAAALLPPDVHESTDYASWSLRFVAALVDIARGDLEVALRLLGSDHQHDFDAAAEFAVPTAEALLWTGRADSAGEDLMALLEGNASSHATLFASSPLLMLARVAADLSQAPRGRAQGSRLAARTVALRARLADDPLGPGPSARPVPGHRAAATAAWHAELARVDGTDTTHLWATAAREWDRICRPHDAAYCRWRAAQVALRDGQGTVAARLLKRAATEAREHVPLNGAIAATAVGVR